MMITLTSLSRKHVTQNRRLQMQEVNSFEPNTVLWHSAQYSHLVLCCRGKFLSDKIDVLPFCSGCRNAYGNGLLERSIGLSSAYGVRHMALNVWDIEFCTVNKWQGLYYVVCAILRLAILIQYQPSICQKSLYLATLLAFKPFDEGVPLWWSP